MIYYIGFQHVLPYFGSYVERFSHCGPRQVAAGICYCLGKAQSAEKCVSLWHFRGKLCMLMQEKIEGQIQDRLRVSSRWLLVLAAEGKGWRGNFNKEWGMERKMLKILRHWTSCGDHLGSLLSEGSRIWWCIWSLRVIFLVMFLSCSSHFCDQRRVQHISEGTTLPCTGA